MSLFVLDTDMLTLLEEGQPVVAKKIASVPPSELAVTVATVEEKLTGWYTLIRRAKKPAHSSMRIAALLAQSICSNRCAFSKSQYQRSTDTRT